MRVQVREQEHLLQCNDIRKPMREEVERKRRARLLRTRLLHGTLSRRQQRHIISTTKNTRVGLGCTTFRTHACPPLTDAAGRSFVGFRARLVALYSFSDAVVRGGADHRAACTVTLTGRLLGPAVGGLDTGDAPSAGTRI